MNKIKPNPKYLHPINAVMIGIMLAIALLVFCSCTNENVDNSNPPVKKIGYIDFHFNCIQDAIWDSVNCNIVIEYNDGSDYNKYNTISDSLFTNYICVVVPNHLAEQLLIDYKDWVTSDDTLYSMHLEYRWCIEEVIQNKNIKFTLKERT